MNGTQYSLDATSTSTHYSVTSLTRSDTLSTHIPINHSITSWMQSASLVLTTETWTQQSSRRHSGAKAVLFHNHWRFSSPINVNDWTELNRPHFRVSLNELRLCCDDHASNFIDGRIQSSDTQRHVHFKHRKLLKTGWRKLVSLYRKCCPYFSVPGTHCTTRLSLRYSERRPITGRESWMFCEGRRLGRLPDGNICMDGLSLAQQPARDTNNYRIRIILSLTRLFNKNAWSSCLLWIIWPLIAKFLWPRQGLTPRMEPPRSS